MARITIVWGYWGPYHCRRFEVLRDYAAREGHQVTGASLFGGSRASRWSAGSLPEGVIHFDLGRDETRFPLGKLASLLAIPRKTRTGVALLPSYDHWSLALNLMVRMAGGRVVMMNDTHGGTARARGLKAAFKRRVVGSFHAGFVAGAPQVRYFASLGLPPEKIFTGYDAVDNDYFARRAEEVRAQKIEVQARYGLPEHYFLSLGRFVPKKNLGTLVRGYQEFLKAGQDGSTHLVMVGSGDEEPALRQLCAELNLPVCDHTAQGALNPKPGVPGVHFYGFREIDENPIFYALADAFILPSLWEEWGLVVNEAMASGLPVVVSETAGCAEDLLRPGRPVTGNGRPVELPQQSVKLSGRIRQNGMVFDPNSAESLADALSAMASAPELRAAMGRASRAIIEDFSCEAFARNALLAAQTALGGNVPPLRLVRPVADSLGAGVSLIL